MARHRFQVGDRVVVNETGLPVWMRSLRGTVVHIREHLFWPYEVQLDSSPNPRLTSMHFRAGELDLAVSEQLHREVRHETV